MPNIKSIPPSSSCPHCGNNPVPHFLNWYFESMNVFLTPMRGLLLNNFLSMRLKKAASSFSRSALRLGLWLHIITLQPNRMLCKVSRAGVLWQEAEKRNIVMKELLLFGRPFDCYVASYKLPATSYQLVFSGLPRPAGYDNSALDTMDDKWLLKKKFMDAHLPVPMGGSCWNVWQAKKIFKNIQATSHSVIVKPRLGSRGRHSTIFVETEADLIAAFKVAKQLCFWVIVEEQLQGPVYRATVINYELCGVLRGDPPQVTGDGMHTVAELITLKNNNKPARVKDIVVDGSMERFLRREFLFFNLKFENPLDVVLPQGKVVNLSEKIGINYGGSSSEDYDICHPDNKELFERAAKVSGDPIVGFDFIIPDIAKSYKEQRCGFIEANSLPFINLHHDPLLGTPRNVAAKVWDMVGF